MQKFELQTGHLVICVSGVASCGLVWSGLVWSGLVWSGIVRYAKIARFSYTYIGFDGSSDDSYGISTLKYDMSRLRTDRRT